MGRPRLGYRRNEAAVRHPGAPARHHRQPAARLIETRSLSVDPCPFRRG
jgi:hypothetical protein